MFFYFSFFFIKKYTMNRGAKNTTPDLHSWSQKSLAYARIQVRSLPDPTSHRAALVVRFNELNGSWCKEPSEIFFFCCFSMHDGSRCPYEYGRSEGDETGTSWKQDIYLLLNDCKNKFLLNLCGKPPPLFEWYSNNLNQSIFFFCRGQDPKTVVKMVINHYGHE